MVRDGEEALDFLFATGKFAGETPNSLKVILLDLKLPKVDGLAFVEALRAEGCPTPQIALISGAGPPTARARALRLGCRIFGKPFALAELLAWFDTVEAQVAPTRALLEWRTQGGRSVRSAQRAWR